MVPSLNGSGFFNERSNGLFGSETLQKTHFKSLGPDKHRNSRKAASFIEGFENMGEVLDLRDRGLPLLGPLRVHCVGGGAGPGDNVLGPR